VHEIFLIPVVALSSAKKVQMMMEKFLKGKMSYHSKFVGLGYFLSTSYWGCGVKRF